MEEKVGQRVKECRKQQGLTLKQLAQKVGCTQSYISQLEKGVTRPSLSMLGKLAEALGINVVDLLSDPSDVQERNWHLPKAERRNLRYPDGRVLSQMLVSRISGKKMEPLISIIKPGGSSHRVEPGEKSGGLEEISHPRGIEEFVLVLKGEIDFQISGKNFLLREGDALYLDGSQPHHWANNQNETAEVLFVFSPPTW